MYLYVIVPVYIYIYTHIYGTVFIELQEAHDMASLFSLQQHHT